MRVCLCVDVRARKVRVHGGGVHMMRVRHAYALVFALSNMAISMVVSHTHISPNAH